MELDALRYPPSICAYEMDNGIYRREVNGMVYIVADPAVMHPRLDAAKRKRESDYRLYLFSKTPQTFTQWLAEREGKQ